MYSDYYEKIVSFPNKSTKWLKISNKQVTTYVDD